ncbi:DUF255 domain-containing protein [Pseudoflavitalea sp. X16]|uniref:thioredoxin family protein n=1 Tax=Paraflavitalea devenefica TaxID=2716334 RepID=UPI0014212D3F|nr:DUF255 domain-containing protein [Paraflavitalea devenefica]NII25843.1 DUF255 domain-containing protein [Paraflavitalea devenefica]
MNRLLCLLIIIPFLARAQEKGIQWTEGLSWPQVKEKAKKENKYIFLDCYTTWCGPCKMMDNQVYSDDSVGIFFNQHFISVKVQFDKTQKDNEDVQRWYDDAAGISRQYHVEAYPTYIFLSPQGVIVHKDNGYKGIKDFVALAQTATMPGKVYKDPYEEYYKLVEAYKQGETQYDSLPLMINIAIQLNDTALQRQLIKTYVDYVCSLPPEQRYTKENIQFWTSYSLGSKTRLFAFFYKDGNKIDKVMNEKGYARKVIDNTIMDEIVTPFFEEQAAGSGIAVTGGYLTDISGKHQQQTHSNEADWIKLKKMIREKYTIAYAKRNVLAAKAEWYNRHMNYPNFTKYALLHLNKYCSIETENPFRINNTAFTAFMFSTDKKVINGYIKWMKKIVINKPDQTALLDTYANLLHKAGKKQEAIQWEEKAMNAAKSESKKEEYRKVIEKMKKGEPTYGAVWGYK